MEAVYEKLQQWHADRDVDVSFILKPHNVLYLAGYASVCSGVLTARDQEPVFCTLWLDGPEAKRNCRAPRMITYRFPEDRLIDRMIKTYAKLDRQTRRVGVEKDYLQLRDYEKLLNAFPNAEFMDMTPALDRLRAIKSDQELAHLRRAARIADEAMAAALRAVRPGVTEIDVAAEAEYVMRKMGSEGPAFHTFVASGERTLLAHPIATRRKILPEEMVIVDLGATWNGYASDLCRTTFSGQPSPERISRLELVQRAQEAAAAGVKDGVSCQEVYEGAYEVFAEAGLGDLLPHDIGYGVGLRQSEFYPIIEKGSQTILKQNMVVALLQTTAYDKRVQAPRVEDMFLVGRRGSERLTKHQQPSFR